MPAQSITVNLPEAIHKRLQHAASAANRSVEEIVFQSIQGNLPPAIEDLPTDSHQELLTFQTMTDQELWIVAKTEVSAAHWKRHQNLLQKKQTKSLSIEEEHELTHLRNATDQLVMRRSYAMALLKWRGYSLAPLLVPTN